MLKKFLCLSFLLAAIGVNARAQNAEVTVVLNETFFDALVDAMFANLKQTDFPISEVKMDSMKRRGNALREPQIQENSFTFGFADLESSGRKSTSECREVVTLQREHDGTRTSVRFHDGKIFAPIAFAGRYNFPLVGCMPFSGIADTNIELDFDRNKQILYGRAKVLTVKLGSVANIAGTLLARFVQGSIDRNINPMPILDIGKLSFAVPIERAGALRVRAKDLKHEVGEGALNIKVALDFAKAD